LARTGGGVLALVFISDRLRGLFIESGGLLINLRKTNTSAGQQNLFAQATSDEI
jgi:hypothetical protein